ncbi:transposase [Cucumis melo var. makuwa]|uniref:Transposase n=1 Tax=Cucumis melo var. makuwa TaxID=1194695 RepID=A0A5D3CGD1_CUCMM|nr:transposase [Cucumis melo var. makuwa]
MKYEKIHAYRNDCCLFRKELSDANVCPSCGMSRWKIPKNSKKKVKNVPVKVMWYFSPIPRFERMFRSKETSKLLTWHARKRQVNDLLQHPKDALSWKKIDNLWPEFGSEPRNLRLALSTDGVNPHGDPSSRYSCWPVMLVTYNLPSWLCMKQKFVMLTTLLSGPKQPKNEIDVYLDVMHIEKNVCAHLIGTLLDIPGKTKDGVKSRLDLVELNIRSELAPQVGEKKIFLPPTCYTLSRAEKLSFCKTLSELKVPEGYSSNIQSLVSLTDLKLYGLKSHDHHVLMQQLLPVAIRGVNSNGLNSSVIKKNSNVDRALSASSFIRPSKEQLDQAHLYVIQKVNDVLPYVEQHMESLRKLNSGKARSKKWIQEEHNRSFSRWLSTRVELALEVPKNSITPSLRWIAHGPSPDCDWVDNKSGVKVDELGFTIVDLKRIGHKSDSFILATQAKQVFYVQDSTNPEWSVVLTSPQRTIEEDFFEYEIGDMLQECGYETIKRMPNVDTPNETDDTNSTYIRHDCEGRWVEKVSNITAIFMMEDSNEDEREMLPEVRKKSFVPRGPTTMSELALVRNSGQKLPIQFNEHGQPVGAMSKKMQSYIGVCVRQQIPITYNSWKEVPNERKDKIYDCISMLFDLQPNAKYFILMSASRKFRTFKTTLTQKYILSYKDQPSLLQSPPKIYSHINQEDWESFVDARLSEEWEDELVATHKNEDILTDALGSKEHGGRARGVGGFVSQSQYFKTVKGKEKMITPQEEDDSICKSDKKRSNHSRSSIGSINIDLDADEDTPSNKGVEGTPCQLSIGSVNNIVAVVVIVEDNIRCPNVKVLVDVEHSTRKDVVYPSNYTDVNGIIKLLNRHAMNNMKDVDMIRIPMNELIFGSDKFVYLAREDLLHYCGMLEIGYMCILAYITFHWMLHVIDLRENCVYVLDSLRSKVNEDIHGVINVGLKTWNAKHDLQRYRLTPKWRPVKCPCQLDSVGCGYYVQKYIHEIVHNSSTSITSLFNTKNAYKQEEIDEIRTEWATFVSRFV